MKILEMCVAKDETRRYLEGIYYDPKHEAAVAVDGHKLAVSEDCFYHVFGGMIIDPYKLEIIDRDFPLWESAFSDHKTKILGEVLTYKGGFSANKKRGREPFALVFLKGNEALEFVPAAEYKESRHELCAYFYQYNLAPMTSGENATWTVEIPATQEAYMAPYKFSIAGTGFYMVLMPCKFKK